MNEFELMSLTAQYDVCVSNSCVTKELVQYRFPKSKVKRIRKKWSKVRSNFRLTVFHRTFKIGNKIYVSPIVYDKILSHVMER